MEENTARTDDFSMSFKPLQSSLFEDAARRRLCALHCGCWDCWVMRSGALMMAANVVCSELVVLAVVTDVRVYTSMSATFSSRAHDFHSPYATSCPARRVLVHTVTFACIHWPSMVPDIVC